jgi:hypothetical protein
MARAISRLSRQVSFGAAQNGGRSAAIRRASSRFPGGKCAFVRHRQSRHYHPVPHGHRRGKSVSENRPGGHQRAHVSPGDRVGTNATEDSNEEFVELHSIATAAVPLFDPANPGNTWRVRGGIEFNFPPGVSLPAQGYLLLVPFNPTTDASALANFRAKYGLPLSVPIYGPFNGKLDNAGESIELYLPDTPQGPGPDQGYVPYVLVDKVAYADGYPWPPEADGTGASLQRRRPDRYANDPVNWKSSRRPQVGECHRKRLPGQRFGWIAGLLGAGERFELWQCG